MNALENHSQNASTHLMHKLAPDAPRLRVDRLLAELYPDLSRSRIKHLIENGFLRCDETIRTSPAFNPPPGAEIVLTLPPPLPATPLGEHIPLDIVFEDDELLVIDKQAGLVVHPAPGHETGTLVNALIHHCGDGFQGIGGERRPGIVHRLDKDTSGLMVVAKTATTHEALSEAFAKRDIDRCYYALSWGLIPTAGEWEGMIGRDPKDRKRMAVVSRNGKPAKTRFKPLETFQNNALTLAQYNLATGRTHQIRVHSSHNGHALVGDPLYLKRIPALAKNLTPTARGACLDFPRQALHAKILGFTHPKTGEKLFFESELPADFQELLASLRE